MRIAVVGGGISGLAAAWDLSKCAEVIVFESQRVGGKIRTEAFLDRPVDCGPDAFITRSPDALALCEEIGVEDLVPPEAGRSLLWWRGKLRPLPEGLVLGVPRRIGPLLASGILSPAGAARAAGDLVLPRTSSEGDRSVRELVASRFGSQVADRLVDPLVGSVYAGRTETMSADATVPQLAEAARRGRSLLWTLRRNAGAGQAGPIFLTPRSGMGSLITKLREGIERSGGRIVMRKITTLSSSGPPYILEPDAGAFDAVVIATEASEAADLLGKTGPEGLRKIRSASVAVVTLAYPSLNLPGGVNGFLAPRRSGWMMTACSFASSKWPHWAPPGWTILRLSAGRDGDDRAFQLSDEDLVGRLTEEVARALPVSEPPVESRVSWWPSSFPQYRPGHVGLVGRINEELRRSHPGVMLCGASYRGIGIPACIASGRDAARRILDKAEVPSG